MKITGIIVDNLFFTKEIGNQMNKVRNLTDCDLLVAVMPGCFDQRGEPAKLNKWRRTKLLLDGDVDLVIELPFAHTVQGVSHYAYAVIETMLLAGVDTFAFASETDNLEELRELSLMSFNVDAIKEKRNDGTAYPKSYGLSAGAYYPHDIAGIAFLRAMKGKGIVPLTFSQDEPYDDVTPSAWSPFYPFLRWKLLTQDDASLSRLFLCDEGMKQHLLKNAFACDSWDAFKQACVTRRYTLPRIQRACCHLMVHTLKSEIILSKDLTVLRILGFDEAGRSYLKELKTIDVRVASRFNQLPFHLRELEYRCTLAYATPLSIERRKALVDREMGGPIIKTSEVKYG